MKPSHHIRSRQALEIRRAIRHSFRINTVLNWQVTIDYGWQEFGSELVPSQQHSNIRKRVWSWWNYKRKKGEVIGKFCDTVIWEAPNGKHHANWLIFCPDILLDELQEVIKNRCQKVLGDQPFDTIHQQNIYNLNGLIDYLLKGTEEEYAKSVGIEPEYQGEVWCRRAVPSISLGRAARNRDWRTGAVVNTKKTKGLPLPREMRVIKREEYYSSQN